MMFRFRYVVLGAHTHVRVFSGTGTLANCGALSFRHEEWQKFMADVSRPDWQFVDDTPSWEDEHQNGQART
jgi:hypothetical protein